MRNKLILGSMLAVLSVPAFATKARLIALGENVQDNIGSLYFSDSRNIFQNPAYINDYKNMVIMEWGASSSRTAPAAVGGAPNTVKGDNDTNPQAEGGVTYGHGNYAYGLYLGAESPYTNEIRSYTRTLTSDSFHQDNQIDAFFGGDTGVKWGVNATYSASKDSSVGARQSSASVRLGVIATKIEGFLNIALKNEARINALGAGGAAAPSINGADKFQGKRGVEAGATYDAEVVKVFGYVRHAEWRHDADSNSTTGVPTTSYTGKFDGTYWLYQVGLGKETKLNERATLFTKAEYLNFKREVDPVSGPATKTVNLNDWRAPITVGLEYDAASWLTVRGSVVQNIMSQVDNSYKGQEGAIAPTISGATGQRASGKRSAPNSTNVNAGATLKFGDLSLDGMIGTGNDGTGAIAATGNPPPSTEKGVLSLDNLMTRVALTYKF